MEEADKTKKQKVPTLDFWFDGYADSDNDLSPRLFKSLTILTMLIGMPLAWILILVLAGYDDFIARYFLGISLIGFMLGIYMTRNSIVEWTWECGACLMQHMERYENFPWISKAASGGIACFLGFCFAIMLPFAISTSMPKKAREAMQLTCLVVGAVACCFFVAYKRARI